MFQANDYMNLRSEPSWKKAVTRVRKRNVISEKIRKDIVKMFNSLVPVD